jgi:hypothetical protein
VLYQQGPPLPAKELPDVDVAEIATLIRSQHKLPPKLRAEPALEQALTRLLELGRAGSPWRDWYTRYARVMTEVAGELGVAPRQFAQLVAIYSPRANPTENLRRALTFIKDNDVLFVGKEPQRAKALAVLRDPDWFESFFLPGAKSPKVKNYYLNALEGIDPARYAELTQQLGLSSPVTVDTHMVNAFLDDITGSSGLSDVYYDGIADAIRQVAVRTGWDPKELQAAAWVAWKAKNEQHRVLERGKKAKPWEEYMPKASDAYERGQERYRGTLYQNWTTNPEDMPYKRMTNEDLMRIAGEDPKALAEFNARMQGEAFNERTLSNDVVPLRGKPAKGDPSPELRDVAADYMKAAGRQYSPPASYAQVDEGRARRIAQWYDEAQHAPDDPAVRASYEAFARETMEQYHALVKAGYKFEFMPPGKDPYDGSPWASSRDISENRHMYVFPTREGFGTELEGLALQHPMLGDSGERWGGQVVTFNDIFRGVHDTFGHAKEGVGFRAAGEENAWRQHVAMYSDEAKPAMTSETRGQNSWVNYGPHGEKNRTATTDTIYADQKAVLAPDWVVREGARDEDEGLRALFQGADDFQRAAAEELQKYAALARDIAKTLPEEEWPAWVRNQIRRQAIGDERPNANFWRTYDDAPGETMFPEEWLEQRGGSLEGVSPWGVKGYAQFDAETAIIGLTTAADETTLFHELAHVIRRFGLTEAEEKRLAKWAGAESLEGKKHLSGYSWSREAEEKFARAVEETIRRGEGPTPIKQALRSLAPVFREVIDMADMPDTPPHVAKMIQGLFAFEKAKGGKLVGAEDILVGQAYAPVVRGMPIKITDPQRAFAAYNRRLTAFFSGGRKSAIGAGPDDKALRKTYEASLLLEGYFTRDVIGPKVDSAILANRMAGATQARKQLLEASSELPADPTDIAIKVDPSQNAPAELAPMFDRLRQLEAGEKLSAKHLDTVDLPMMEAARDLLFPSRIGDRSAAEAAAHALETETPIDNIRWISKEALERTNFLHVQSASQKLLDGLPATAQKTLKAAGISWDGLNDFQRAQILYLNPAYAPMQLIGNLGMNLLQQGAFMPVNLWKAAMMHWDLAPLDRLTVDAAMGMGAANALSMRTGPGKLAQATLGHWANLVADTIPRRSAFLHEVRKAKVDDLAGLLKAAREGDEGALATMDDIARRAKRAIVDFDRLSPFERDVISRYIFFYPWLRGATEYSVHFIADHPVQAMALALAYEHLKAAQDEQLGDRPRYAEMDVPISTKSVGLRLPFSDLDVSLADIADKTWLDEDGNPMVFKLRQALTMTTPMEIGQEIISFAGSKDRETSAGLVQHLTPVPYAAGVAGFGYDPFKQREVEPGLATFFGEFGPAESPIGDRIEAVTMSDAERAEKNEKAMYPRKRRHELWRLGFGSLAPTPYVKEIGQERAAQRERERMSLVDRRRAEFDDDAKAAGMEGDIPPRVYNLLDDRSRLDEELEDGMTYAERLSVLGRVLRLNQPSDLPEPIAERRYRALREVYFGPLLAYERRMDKRLDAKLED